MSDSPDRKRRGLWLVLPFSLVFLIAAAYSAYWFWAKNVLDDGIDDWIASERAAGRTVEFSSKSLGGFPFRFALQVDDPVYADPRAGQSWEGQKLQLVMQPWNWQHVIARTPGANTLRMGGQVYRLELGRKSAGSLSWNDEGIRRASVSIDTLTARQPDQALGRAEGFEFHLRPPPGEAESLQLQTQWDLVELTRPVPDAEFLGTRFGPSILRAEASKAVPALELARDMADLPATILDIGGDITLAQFILEWGPADLGARGRLDRNVRGDLEGQIDIRLERHEALKAALRESGRLEDDTEQAIDMVAAASENGEFLSLSIRRDGLYFLGNRILAADIDQAL